MAEMTSILLVAILVAPLLGSGAVIFLWRLYRLSDHSWLLWSLAASMTVTELGALILALLLIGRLAGVSIPHSHIPSLVAILLLELAPVWVALRLRMRG